MKPIRLQAENFRTFRDLDVYFDDGLVGILGEIRDSPGSISSNGAGKSTLLEGIDVALFGRRSLAGFITRGDDAETFSVTLTFTHAGETYRVRRSLKRGKTAKCDLEKRWSISLTEGVDDGYETLTRETTKQTDLAIIEVLNLTRATFRDSGYLRQGGGSYADPARDPKERLDLLVEAALGRDPVWPKVLDAARAARKTAEASLERLAGETSAARELLATKGAVQAEDATAWDNQGALEELLVTAELILQESIDAYQAARDQAAQRQVAEAEARQAIDAHLRASQEWKAAVEAADALAEKRIELEKVAGDAALVPEIEARVAQLRVDATNLQNALGARATLTTDADTRDLARTRMLSQATQLEADAKVMRGKAAHLIEHIEEAGECDRCHQRMGVEAATRAAQSYRDEADALDAKAIPIRQGCDAEYETIGELRRRALAVEIPVVDETQMVKAEHELTAARDAAVKRATLDEQVMQFTVRAAKRTECEQATQDTAATVATKQAALGAIEPVDLAAIEAAGTVARRTVAQRRLDLDEAKVQRGRLDEKLTMIAKASAALDEAKATEAELQASVDVESVIEKACGRAGIPTLILEAVVIPTLEAKAAHILAELGTGYRVELRTQKANQDGGLRDTCEAVVIDANGHEGEFGEGFSEGQKTRIALALQLALADFLASKPGAEATFLAIDEPAYLDSAGMNALLDVLRDLLARKVFESILLVSHAPELRDSLDQNILVVMEGGVSRIDAPETTSVAVTA